MFVSSSSKILYGHKESGWQKSLSISLIKRKSLPKIFHRTNDNYVRTLYIYNLTVELRIIIEM